MILGFEMKRNTLDTINFHHMSIAKQQSSQNPDNHQGFDSASGALIEGCWTHSPQKATPANWLLAESPSTNHHKIPRTNWLLAASPSSNHHKILTTIKVSTLQAGVSLRVRPWGRASPSKRAWTTDRSPHDSAHRPAICSVVAITMLNHHWRTCYQTHEFLFFAWWRPTNTSFLPT